MVLELRLRFRQDFLREKHPKYTCDEGCSYQFPVHGGHSPRHEGSARSISARSISARSISARSLLVDGGQVNDGPSAVSKLAFKVNFTVMSVDNRLRNR
jgi:hypothetical protein